jgi:hypothetical protein
VSKGFLDIRLCDLCRTSRVRDKVETHWFALGNRQTREIDLCAAEWRKMQRLMAPYLEKSRKPSMVASQVTLLPRPSRAAVAPAVRAWAIAEGMVVKSRGELSKAVYDAFYEAHPEGVLQRPAAPPKWAQSDCLDCGERAVSKGRCLVHYNAWYHRTVRRPRERAAREG